MASVFSILLLLSHLLLTSDSYKFLVYPPFLGYSHTNFLGAIADTLTEAGHNVTMLMPVMDTEEEHRTGVKLTKNIIKVPAHPRVAEYYKHRKETFGSAWTMQPSVWGSSKVFQHIIDAYSCQCEKVLDNENLLQRLKAEKFDVGIAEPATICGLGIFEVANIPASIAAWSLAHSDVLSKVIGEPNFLSYVPGGLTGSGDRMSMKEKLLNFVDFIHTQILFRRLFEKEIGSFRRKFGPHFKNWEQLLAETKYLVTNSNPYLDYPCPTLHKTVAIGGITVTNSVMKDKLSEKWDAILNKRNHSVLISFGSMAKAMYMPDKYKNTLLRIFESMPDTTFIMKYEEKETLLVDHLPNVYMGSWLSQNALFADSRLTAFVTHAGLGSTTELVHQGKPAILIPLFGDQPRNAGMLARHGGCIVLSKFDLEDPKKLADSLLAIFNDPSYSRSAKRLSEMLLSQSVSAKELLLRHCEFAARFGRLVNLDPYGRQLSFVQYYLTDIALIIVSALTVVTYIIWKLCRIKCTGAPDYKND